MKYNLNGYKFNILENHSNKTGYRITHNNNQFCTGYTFKTIQSCIDTIKYMIENKQTYLLIK